MRLSSIRIKNYKGFADSGLIELGKYWTVIVGRNNAGKTAFLECLSFNSFQDKPHRNISQDPLAARDPKSRMEMSVALSGKELERIMLLTGDAYYVPVPPQHRQLSYLKDELFKADCLQFNLSKVGGGGFESRQFPSHGLFKSPENNQPGLSIRVHVQGDRQGFGQENLESNRNDNLAVPVGGRLGASAYVFRAERRVAGISPAQNTLNLAFDASNLAGALNYYYTSNPTQFFKAYMSLVRQVLPDIEGITIPPHSGPTVQIQVWSSGYEQGRSELAIPLDECGTGIGQVLAILFIAVTAESGRIIVIDEPNSFLHPGASRVLMQLLRSFHQHQFIVTTHSPEIISATTPDKLAAIQWKDGESQVTVFDGTAVAGNQLALNELGVRLSDVFGYDAIAWVEGLTEAKCFPLVLHSVGLRMPPRTAFVPVIHTGDFDGPNADTFLQAYKALAEQSPFMPQAISISFDRENRNANFCADLTKRSGGLMRFLPRLTYENYLIHPPAIAAVLRQEEGCSVIAEDVQKWVDAHRLDAKYYARSGGTSKSVGGEWLDVIHAPKFLGDLVGQLTNHTQDFNSRKVKYSLALTNWILENDKPFLSQLTDYIRALIEPVAHSTTTASGAKGSATDRSP